VERDKLVVGDLCLIFLGDPSHAGQRIEFDAEAGQNLCPLIEKSPAVLFLALGNPGARFHEPPFLPRPFSKDGILEWFMNDIGILR